MPLNSQQIKRLLQEKFPPTTANERVYASVLIALSENVDKQEKQLEQLVLAASFIAKKLNVTEQMVSAALSPQETTASTTPTVTQESPSVSTDNTPFPEGVAASAPPGSVPSQAPPIPNAGGSGALNAQPIPTRPTVKAPTPAASANGNGKGAV